ncbi:L-2,4-diaminobutyrate decarboxylase [Jatrophihabitans endophyticus]|uniref:L-2,4-diaminobutyrate decarboxylase n=1 Tax=Jatrophihabitans endophyticus TaxID=1206085 RepID=A0A1M5SVB3_9ACTN|nr:aspartate aminotransferase family protein [Jatrophihabitans endophyticus]SHH42429.1 L-2,4-diaminobutyrate decarboxylase [Jatrophihabitans endophyticus]
MSSQPAPLLDGTAATAYAAAITAARDEVVTRLQTVERPFTGVAAAELRKRIADVDLDAPLSSSAAVLAEVGELYLHDAVWFHHPRYLAHLNCPVAVPAVAADVLASAVNSSLDTWDQSAGATYIERRLVGWTAARLGLGDRADGVFTSGGSQSNLQALLIARENAGGTDLSRLRVLVSADGHFSVAKSARLLGLGPDAVVEVAVDEGHRMRPDDLERRLLDLRAYGLVPMAVVATAGTTDFGAIDPLADVAAVAHRHATWLHVDAAYGGGLLTSTRHRDLLAGIEAADSVTVDYHKTFFQPVASSVVLVRDAVTLRHVAWHADYLNPADADPDDRPNQVDKSLQTTRRFDALKLWCTLRELGPDRIGAMLDTVVDLATATGELLADDPDFALAAVPSLSTVVFRYTRDGVPDAVLDDVNTAARAALLASGEGVVASTTVAGRVHLKVTLLNPATSLDDVRFVVDRLREYAADELAVAA